MNLNKEEQKNKNNNEIEQKKKWRKKKNSHALKNCTKEIKEKKNRENYTKHKTRDWISFKMFSIVSVLLLSWDFFLFLLLLLLLCCVFFFFLIFLLHMRCGGEHNIFKLIQYMINTFTQPEEMLLWFVHVNLSVQRWL